MRSVISPVLPRLYGFVGFCKMRWFFAWKREEIPHAPVRQTSFRVEFMGITGAYVTIDYRPSLKTKLSAFQVSWSAIFTMRGPLEASGVWQRQYGSVSFAILGSCFSKHDLSDVRRSSGQIELLGLQNQTDTALAFFKEGQDATKFTLITNWFRVRKLNHLKLPVVVLFKGKVFKSANKNL